MRAVIETDRAPAAIGPYSQAIRAGGFLYISGQIPLDPATGKLIEGNMSEQTERIMTNMKSIAEAAGATLTDLVKTTIFLLDLADFGEVNTAYGRFFEQAPPARSTIQVAALPLGARIEIEAVLLLPQSS